MSMVNKIIIVDDDKEILENLKHIFKQRHNVDAVVLTSGNQVVKHLKAAVYDAVVVDLMLPGIDGHKLCREIRKVSDVPIVMITAIQDVSERLLAFEVGVDDFMVKPFNVNELTARIEAIHKRINAGDSKALKNAVYHFAGWSLNTATFCLTSPDDVEVDLSSADYKLLIAFLEHPNRVLSRDYLVEYTQNRHRDVFDRSIDVRVSLLRKKLQTDTGLPVIKTVHGQGYMLTVKVDKEALFN